MQAPAHRRKDRSRIAAALLAALFVFSQLHSFAHFSFVQHELCPVDGEVAHASHGHGPQQHLASPSGVQDPCEDVDLDQAGQVLASAPAEEAEHADHCQTIHLQEQRRAQLVSDAACLGMAPSVVSRGVVTHRAPRPGGPSVLSLAPKQSPPAFV